MAKLTVPTSNALRFVNYTYYDRTIANHSTRLYPDYLYQGRYFQQYYQKIEQTDSVWFQILTDYLDFQLLLVECSTGNQTNIRSSLNYLTDSNGLSIYECTLNVASLSGVYYLILRSYQPFEPLIEFRSEKFHVKNEWENTLLMKWQGNSTMNDGMYWEKYQQLRVEGKITKTEYGANKSFYDDSNMELITLRFNPSLTYRLDIQKIPYWIAEKINLAIGHDEFWCNDLLLNTSDVLELENFNGTTLFKGQLMLRAVKYENYSDVEELTGDIPVYQDAFFLINDNDNILINATDILKINN
jgi:hypothetical protein